MSTSADNPSGGRMVDTGGPSGEPVVNFEIHLRRAICRHAGSSDGTYLEEGFKNDTSHEGSRRDKTSEGHFDELEWHSAL
ncbi:hypothetical protein V492_00242 [Pseudogymnoascus sp. VKM F-4246]|nr:hypothetical protein V492_00242 [Pseudogymnoascus sp. VKM F-4246]